VSAVVEEGSWVGELYKIFFDLFFLFLKFGGVLLKKSELILRAIGSAGGIPPQKNPSARPQKRPFRTCLPASRQAGRQIGRFPVFLWRQIIM
jgi:hypothetical protein